MKRPQINMQDPEIYKIIEARADGTIPKARVMAMDLDRYYATLTKHAPEVSVEEALVVCAVCNSWATRQEPPETLLSNALVFELDELGNQELHDRLVNDNMGQLSLIHAAETWWSQPEGERQNSKKSLFRAGFNIREE